MPEAASAAYRALLAPLPGLRMLPVRHHSPRCSHHLQQLLAEFQPDLVLIEGPDELNALLPALRHASAKPPLAAYLHSELQQEEGSLRCRGYVPFVDFSPEWLALRVDAEVRFIDLAWGQRLEQAEDAEFFATAPEPLLAIEPAQQAPDVLARLIEQADCRDFDEWWDRHFESGCAPQTAEVHFASLLAFSLLLRAGRGGDDLENQAREQQMAAGLRTALAEEGKRILLVCGGFHVPGILARIADLLPQATGAALTELGFSLNPAPLRLPAHKDEVGVHLIPYSLQRLAVSSGYAAGLPDPGFYQGVWQDWQAGKPQPWQAGWPALAARLTTDLRKGGLPVTLPDAAEAVGMAGRLAALRGHPGGRSELLESLQSTLVRDSGDLPHFERAIAAVLAPPLMGELPPNAPVAPLLQDVQAFCRQWKLPDRPLPAKRRELDLYRHERHRLISRGLHRLRFLEVPYAEREAGPDFVAGTDLQRVREIWSLSWQVETAVRLTEVSRYGASLEEAAVNRLLELLRRPAGGNPAQLVLEVLVMGLSSLADQVLDAVAVWLQNSFDALQLAEVCTRLAQAAEARAALGEVEMPRLLPLLDSAWQQTCQHLPSIGQGDASQIEQAVDALADLHGMACRDAPWADRDALLAACTALQNSQVASRVCGAAAGVLTMSGAWSEDETAEAISRQLGLSHLQPGEMGEYLIGFLRIARGWLLGHPPTLQRITDCISAWSEDDFLAGLPPLRLAFNQLTRREQRELARQLAGDDAAAALLDAELPDESSLQASHALHALVSRVMHDWGFHA